MARIRILQKAQVLHFYRHNTAQDIGLQSVLVPRRSICSKNTSLFQQQNEWDQDREKINLKKFRDGFSKNEPVSQINVNHAAILDILLKEKNRYRDTIEQLDREEENHILTKNKLELEMVNIDAIKAELDIERSKVSETTNELEQEKGYVIALKDELNLNNTKVNALVIELNLATSKLDAITNELKEINTLVDSLNAKIAKQDSALEGEKKKFNALDKGLNQESATLEATKTELNEALALVESMKSIALKKEKQTLEHLNTVTLELNDAKSMIDIMKAELEKTNTALDQELSSHISTKNALEKMAADLKSVKKTQMSAQSDFDQSKTDLELETLLHEQKIVAAKEEVNVLKNQLASEQEKNTVLMKKLADGEKNMKHLLNAAEKQAKNVNTKNVELGDLEIIKKELDQEKSKVILAINELNVERELHSATKKELKYANLPAWTKLQKWAEEIK